MKVVLLAGGLGTGLSEETDVRPKPMVEVGGRPILWHLMSSYASAGFEEFIVALGYKQEVVKDYFRSLYATSNDLTLDISTGHIEVRERSRLNWKVHLVDTGLSTMTGGRIKRLQSLIGDETFMCTYGDGLASIDVAEVVRFHKAAERQATVTAVRPPARFGKLDIDGDRVARFIEKLRPAKAGSTVAFSCWRRSSIEREAKFSRTASQRQGIRVIKVIFLNRQ